MALVLKRAISKNRKTRADRYALQAHFAMKRYSAALQDLEDKQKAWAGALHDYNNLLKEFQAFDELAGYPDRAKCIVDRELDNIDIFDERDASVPTTHFILLQEVHDKIVEIIEYANRMLTLLRIELKSVKQVGLSMDIFEPELDTPFKDYELPELGWYFFFPYVGERESSDIE